MKEVFENIIKCLVERQKEHQANMDMAKGLYIKSLHEARASEMGVASEIVKQAAKEYKGGWIPADMEVPPNDNYVLVSFENYNLPDIARYEEDSEGGAFYPGDEEKSYSSFGLFVNAWQPLQEPYRPESKSEVPNSWQQQTMSRFERVD